jgi:hypothetical protein
MEFAGPAFQGTGQHDELADRNYRDCFYDSRPGSLL